MTKPFGKLKTDGLEKSTDRVGGFKVFESGLYDSVLKMAYATNSKSSDAEGMVVTLDTPDGEYTETIWVTNRDGENFVEKDGKKVPTMGYDLIDALCFLTTGFSLDDQEYEMKKVGIYDYDTKKEIPTDVYVPVNMIGKPVIAGIQKIKKNKQKKSGTKYIDTNEVRMENRIDKFFHKETRVTVVEAQQGIEEPIFIDIWDKKNTGNEVNQYKEVSGSGASGSGAPKGAGSNGAGGTKSSKPLFGG